MGALGLLFNVLNGPSPPIDAPPPLPGGYTVGEKVFYTAASQTLSNGNKLVHSQQGEVTGPATVETYKGKGVNALFPGNKGSVLCLLASVRRLRAASDATLRLTLTSDADYPKLSRTASAPAPQPLNATA